MEAHKKYDIVIIGAGPIGLACGIEAKKAGLKYLILEKGCLVNSLYRYPFNMTFFSTSEKLEIGGVPFISHGPKPNRAEALEYYRRVASSWQLEIKLYEKVEAVHKANGIFEISTAKQKYHSKALVLSLGFYDLPYLLHVPGEDLPKVRHYYDEPHPYFNQKIVVVGAANSAVDVALETWRKGADVTMVIREPGIKDTVKYWVKPDIENRIKEGGIKAYFNSEVTNITPHHVDIKTPEGPLQLENDFVLAMTGYQPPFDFMKSLGIQFQNDEYHTPVYNEGTMESSVDNLYLAGVVCGGLKTNKWFIENSRVHAGLIIDAVKSKTLSVKQGQGF
ncbi:MAG TPA: YpdA family putative bacillithiol disulfide reductase [Cyclobacteriaceae bacterium]|nr:YpdA family putative bacillithiol disulfide reductase [Cyclobacteriaceae bacterium]MCB9237767.1 YpdA family putative bacillithiol disulfide reductase [Flammeovirgaceae bacterium]MCB0498721.1 YpdA family putative bacillithiol disulfide reductase [Cyclobacteriaceae bacterium]MCO5270132.1 YpdA family putative bacillithiol disulfide reductase [Cyclobacteriaceae bacterium]MCW5903128.1 YpdA family putative bacillithiol disulfide reductase [Cyclobacteriaceae bacterium]